MKKYITVVTLFLLITMGIFAFFKMSSKQKDTNFESQLIIFESLGFRFNEGTSQEDILDMWGKEALEQNAFTLLYISLGATIEREPWTPITDQVWHFDTEAIEDHGDYTRILENIKRISSGQLNFQNIQDYVDIEENKASISFELNGDSYKWDLQVQDDWVDEELFSKIVQLTNKYKTNGKLTYFNTGGQDLVLGWATREQLKRIKNKTGLNIVWLD